MTLDDAAQARLIEQVFSHPGWRDTRAIEHAGFDTQTWHRLQEFDPSDPAQLDALGKLGITVKSRSPEGVRRSRVFIEPTPGSTKFTITIGTTGTCVAVFAPGNLANGSLDVNEAGHLLVMGAGTTHSQSLNAQLRGPECAVAFGHHASSFGIRCAFEGPRRCFVFGAGSMASAGIQIYGTDYHGILSLESGMVINEAADVIVEEHVWLGIEAMVMKGVRLGRGTIVGARSLVTSDIPPFCAVGGAPARVLRDKVTWNRQVAFRLAGRAWQVEEDFTLTPRLSAPVGAG